MAVRLFLRPVRALIRELCNGDADPGLYLVIAVSLLLCAFHLHWGLPNGNFSWAADALGPLSVLSIAKRSLSKFNSGWFWYKYPFGYPLILLAIYAPYLGWLVLSGQLSNPSTVYPYGFADPERALFVLAMLGRSVNVLLIVATVALTYAMARRFFGVWEARLAAWFVATAYPMVFYAHTTNQDAAYVLWLTLAVWATIVGAEGAHRRWPFAVLGFAAAMAMATKEQGFALLLTLPFLLAIALYHRTTVTLPWPSRLWQVLWNRGALALLLATVGTTLIANNALINPQGVLNRILDLTGHPIAGISSRLTPIKFALFKGVDKELWYLRQLYDVTESTFGLPLFLIAIAGLVYLIVAQRRAAAFLLIPALAYYFVSLRTHDLLALRYVLPLLPILAVAAATLLMRVRRSAGSFVNVVVALLCLVSLARAVEMNVLLRTDSRYQAEDWLAQQAPDHASIEFYQKPVYVPRLSAFAARQIPLDERTIDGVAVRKPDFIVLSSAGRKSITHFWNPDWTKGSLLLERPDRKSVV